MEPPGYYRRFSLTYWVSWHVSHGARRFCAGLAESWRWGWQQWKEDVSRKPAAQPQKDRPLLKLSLTCLPIIALIIIGPPEWFFNRVSILVIAVFLIWVLRSPLKSWPTWLRKLVSIFILTIIVSDFLSLSAWQPAVTFVTSVFDTTYRRGSGLIFLVGIVVWWVGLFAIIYLRPKRKTQAVQFRASQPVPNLIAPSTPAPELRVPKIRFADVGGMDDAKEQIREVVEGRLSPKKYAAYGISRNGILLYGPRGSGKTYLAEATAGEFKLNFHYLSPTKFITMWIGETEASIRGAFSRAMANRPVLLFIDEIDALGSFRQNTGAGGDPGGGGRAYNNMTIELMQSIDQVRAEPGFIVMAATNLIDGLDEALVRDGRFDVKVHVDMPDEPAREKIFIAQLAGKPWAHFDLKEFARRTPGASDLPEFLYHS